MNEISSAILEFIRSPSKNNLHFTVIINGFYWDLICCRSSISVDVSFRLQGHNLYGFCWSVMSGQDVDSINFTYISKKIIYANSLVSTMRIIDE
jgi:hypothetical protein